MRWVFAVCGGCLLILMVASRSQTQTTHPCDLVISASGTITTQTVPTVYFCAPQSDNIKGAFFYVNGTTKQTLANFAAVTGPSSTGKIQYSGTVAKMTKGTWSVTVSTYNLLSDGTVQEGPVSSPFSLSVVDPVNVPSAPDHVQVK